MLRYQNLKKCCAVLLVIVLVLSVAACGQEKEPMTAKHFKTTMEDLGFTVTDQTASAQNNDFQHIYVAADEEKYSFEYYFMRNDMLASNLYDNAVKNVEANYKDDPSAVITGKSTPQSGSFTLRADDYYVRIIRTANAVLYVTAYAQYQDECKTLIKKLGY